MAGGRDFQLDFYEFIMIMNEVSLFIIGGEQMLYEQRWSTIIRREKKSNYQFLKKAMTGFDQRMLIEGWRVTLPLS